MRKLLTLVIGMIFWANLAFRALMDFGIVGLAPLAWWVWSYELGRRNV